MLHHVNQINTIHSAQQFFFVLLIKINQIILSFFSCSLYFQNINFIITNEPIEKKSSLKGFVRIYPVPFVLFH
jgi:hypothetical protein